MVLVRPLGVAAALLIASAGCDSARPPAFEPLPPVSRAPLTTEVKLSLRRPILETPDQRSPNEIGALTAMLSEGFGDFDTGAGEPHMTRVAPNAGAAPALGDRAKMLVRFAHLSDAQITDDESPTRVSSLDGPGRLNSAARAQDAELCRMLNATVRTLNAVHRSTPLSFVLLGGDNTDSAQENELDWVMSILGGRDRVECDSGADDNPQPDEDDDGKDPFVAEGLLVPWYWVTGNHDVCVQGQIVIGAEARAQAIGAEAATGTRFWGLPGGPIRTGPIPADARRALIDRSELMRRIAADRDGHGVGPEQVIRGKAYYSIDVPGTQLRFIVLDTAAETGGASGVIHRKDLDEVIMPMIEEARADDKWIILAAHHSPQYATSGDEFGGTRQEDAVSAEEIRRIFGAEPRILFSMIGHAHRHAARFIEAGEGRGFWEVVTAAISDYPSQVRLVEIWEQDEWLMLRATGVDFSTENDPVAAWGRKLSIADVVSGWSPNGTGRVEDRNVELWIKKPAG